MVTPDMGNATGSVEIILDVLQRRSRKPAERDRNQDSEILSLSKTASSEVRLLR